MTEFHSQENVHNVPARVVFDKLSDLSSLKTFLANVPEDKIPADKREMFESLEIEPDYIQIQGGPTGSIKLVVTERVSPALIRLKADNIPMDVCLLLRITPVDEAQCRTQVAIEADIPIFLKGMVSKPMQQVVDQFAQLLAAVNFQ